MKSLLFLALFILLIPCLAFSGEPVVTEGDTATADTREQLLDRYKETPMGSFLEWLFDEDRKYFAIPVISSGPDTGWLLGLAWYHTDLFGKEKRDMILGAITTQSGQNNAMVSWTEPGIPLKDGRIALSAFLSENPRGGIRYFGEGNRTAYKEVASNYRSDSRGFGAGYIYEFTGHLTLYSGYHYSEKEFGDPADDFDLGDDEASRPISEVHPEVFGSRAFQQGYIKAGVGLSLSYDSRSRERLLRQGPGWRASAGGSWADRSFGGRFDWADWHAKFAHYIGLTENDKHILAYTGSFTYSWGQEPFDEVPGLSSSDVRGYYSGRFRGDNKIEASIEYRWYATKHFGMALFADSGKVFDHGTDFYDAFFTDYHPAWGAGLRLKIPPQIIFRIDYGMSFEQDNFYFTIGESF